MFTKTLKLTLILALLPLTLACALTRGGSTQSQGDPVAEEQAVYAALMPGPRNNGVAVISAMTSTGLGAGSLQETLDYIQKQMPDASRAVVTDFSARNDQEYPLAEDMQIGTSYHLLTETERQAIFNDAQDGWDTFYKRYPDAPGIVTFSRVGFNADFSEALVYMGQQGGWLMGSGFFFRLEKKGGQWVIKDQVMVWIS